MFDQYLRTTQIPRLEYYLDGKKVFYRWTNSVKGFNLPLVLKNETGAVKIIPSSEWQHKRIKTKQKPLFDPAAIEKMYYISAAVVH